MAKNKKNAAAKNSAKDMDQAAANTAMPCWFPSIKYAMVCLNRTIQKEGKRL